MSLTIWVGGVALLSFGLVLVLLSPPRQRQQVVGAGMLLAGIAVLAAVQLSLSL